MDRDVHIVAELQAEALGLACIAALIPAAIDRSVGLVAEGSTVQAL